MFKASDFMTPLTLIFVGRVEDPSHNFHLWECSYNCICVALTLCCCQKQLLLNDRPSEASTIILKCLLPLFYLLQDDSLTKSFNFYWEVFSVSVRCQFWNFIAQYLFGIAKKFILLLMYKLFRFPFYLKQNSIMITLSLRSHLNTNLLNNLSNEN